jgi:hypothetical protein
LADGPRDFTTTTLAAAAVDPKAIAAAVPHSISLRIIQAPRFSIRQVRIPRLAQEDGGPSRLQCRFARKLSLDLSRVN